MKKPIIKTNDKGYWIVDYQRPYKRLSMEDRAVVHSCYNLVQRLNYKGKNWRTGK